jgi:hypothetical protein
MKKAMGVTAILVLSGVVIIGCGGGSSSSSSGSNNITQAETGDFVSLLAGSAVSGLNSSAQAQGRPAGMLKGLPARMLKGTSFAKLHVTPQTLTVQCNSNGTSCTFLDQFSVPYSCQSGGTMNITGDMNGTGTPNMAYLSIQVTETINNWTCDGPTINGDPYVSLTGTYTYPADSLEMTLSGGFIAGGQSCQLNVSINAGSDGHGDISGVACGYTINSSF